MNKLLLATIFLLSSTMNVTAQSRQEKQLIKNIDQLITNQYASIAPGCIVLIAKKGQIIYNKPFGTANLELNVPLQPAMIFRIGSITKQYTAIAILQLVEQGKVSLQDNIQKFVKNFPDKGHIITIENLLSHTSGIADYESLDFHIPNAIRIDISPKQLIDSIAKLPLNFTPSTRYQYSNTNYLLLGCIIEQASGKSYKSYLQDNVFKPAGLSNTYYDSPTDIIKNRITGYTKDSSTYRNVGYISMSQVFSAGALLSTAEDLFQWHQALYMNKLVKKETLEKAFTPFKLKDNTLSEYGYGWFIKDWEGSKSIGHGGAIDGFRSMELYFPKQDIFVAALFNSDNDNFSPLFESITSLAMGESQTGAANNVKLNEETLNKYIGSYKNDKYNTVIRIYKENGSLYCDLSNGTGSHMGLVPQSENKFKLAIRKTIWLDFVVEAGKTSKIIVTQQQKAEYIKIE